MTHRDQPSRRRAGLEGYHRPGEVPREEMWARIARSLTDHELGRLDDTDRTMGVSSASSGDEDLVRDDDLARARARKSTSSPAGPARLAGWAVAAAAVLALGVGIGRMTAPAGPTTTADAGLGSARGAATSGLALAAREHLDRSESLLTLVRADARDGRVDPMVGEWARGLLSQTRLILDRDGIALETRDLLLDLELVLAQVVSAAAGVPGEGVEVGTETSLTVDALEEGQLLSRIQMAVAEPLPGT